MTDAVDPGPDMAAAELALGVLDGAERAGALRRVLAEPDFAAAVAWWREQLAVLADEVPAVQPDAGLFAQIEQRLSPVAATPARRGWLWPGIAGLTSLAAAASIALLVTQPEPAPRVVAAPPVAPPALLAAAIAPTGAGTPLSAIYDPAAGALRVTAGTLAGADRSAELWVIGGDGVPYSLGLLRRGAPTTLPVAPLDRARLAADAVLAVSIEPLGGSPGPAPTGPVVATGKLSLT